MKPKNAKMTVFSRWAENTPTDLEQVMDFARGLENSAHRVIQPWYAVDSQVKDVPPGPDDIDQSSPIQVGDDASIQRGWLCARLTLPDVAALFSPDEWGEWCLQLDSDGLVDVYCDGALVDRDRFLHSETVVGKAGDSQLPWISCFLDTTIQNLRWEMARVRLNGLEDLNRQIRDLARSLRTGASLLMTDNPRENRFISGQVAANRSTITAEERTELTQVLISAAAAIDVRALVGRDRDAFIQSLSRCQDQLVPLADFAKRFHIYLLGVSHMDLAWKWRWGETVECMHGTLKNQIEFMREREDFTFLESSPPVWEAMKDKDPELYEDIRSFGRKGQFEPAGGMWCEPDGQMLSGESWVRQLLYGQKASQEILGFQSPAGHNTDAFGFTWALPKIYQGGEIDAFITQKMRYNEFTIFEEVLFWWESDDGSRILGIHTYPDHYQEVDCDELVEAMRIFHVTSGVYSSAILFGIGNHGGGPLPDMFDRVDDMRKQTVCPHVHLGGMVEYLEHLKKHEAEALERLPVLRDEMFLECHHKTYTTQVRVKAANRHAERSLYTAEVLSVLAGLPADERLEKAWKIALFNQFHDILPGTSFPMVYQDVYEDYEKADGLVQSVTGDCLERIVGSGENHYIINTLPWQRNAVITSDCGAGHLQPTYEGDGFVGVAKDLPALGVIGGDDLVPCSSLSCGDTWAENQFFRVEFDAEKGFISSLRLTDGPELAGNGIGRLDLLEDASIGVYQTWNMNLTGRVEQAKCQSFEVLETGPVRARFRAQLTYVDWEKKKDFMVPIMWHTPGVDYPTSFFTVDFIVYADLPWIQCEMAVDWWEDDTILKVAADTSLQDTKAHYAIPFGQIERPTKRETPWEQARYEVPALSWADITDGENGVAIFNTSHHGHDALGSTLRLSLLTSPYGGEKVHVTDPLADRGKHNISYAFYPHQGGPGQGDVARMAMEYENNAVLASGSKPSLPLGEDLLKIDPDHFLATAIKPAETGNGLILRGFESKGADCDLTVSGSLLQGKTPHAVNLLEHETNEITEGLGPHQLFSVRYE